PAGGSWPRASTGSPTCPPPPAGPWRCTWPPGGTCRTCRPPPTPNAPISPSSTSRCCSAWTATSWPRTARRCQCPIFPVGTRHPCTKAATTCGCTCSCSRCAAPPISSSTWPAPNPVWVRGSPTPPPNASPTACTRVRGFITDLLPAWDDAGGARRPRTAFDEAFPASPDGVWPAPGRVNLNGEHTDYNGGLCLPIALEHRTYVALRHREDDRIRLGSDREEQTWESALGQVAPGAVRGWGAYPAGVAWALAQEGHDTGGFDAAVVSGVPYGAGLSSSAALECAFAAAFAAAPNWQGPSLDDDAGRAELARMCVRAENEIAGANTGGMDQAASLRATAGHALLLDTQDGSVRQFPFDLTAAGLELLVIDTRAEHALVDGQYAQRRATCEAAAAALGVATLREITPQGLPAALDRLDSQEQ